MTLPIEERIQILKNQPLFSQMNESTLSLLADLTREIDVPAGEIIVGEGDLIDAFFIIVQGEVEIYKQVLENDATVKVSLAVLRTNEAIGIDSVGFYSATGVRSATAIAITNSVLLSIHLNEFQMFLEKNLIDLPAMQAANSSFLRMLFIKSLLPFADLQASSIAWLEKQVQEIKAAPNTVLFKQGECGETCYFIRKGTISIYTDYDSEDPHWITTISAPNMVGEAAMLLGTPRSATAVTKDECVLLLMTKEQLQHLQELENHSLRPMLGLIIERARPLREPHVSVHQNTSDDGEIIYTLRNDKINTYYQLSEPGYFVWQLCDGLKTMRDITLRFKDKYAQFSPATLSNLVFSLAKVKFLSIKGFHIADNNAHRPLWVKISLLIARVMEAKYAFKNTDGFVTACYHRLRFWYTKPGIILSATMIVLGALFFFIAIPKVIYTLHELPHATLISMIIAVQIFSLPLIFMHELGHALTTKYYGRMVSAMGFGWYWLGPMAYTDTSDMWLANNKQRIVVNIAGAYIDAVIAFPFALLAWLSPFPILTLFCWFICIGKYYGILSNLDPILELDGYYILADSLNESELREKAVTWLSNTSWKNLITFNNYAQNKKVIFFWLSCGIHIIISSLLAWLLQHYILSIIFPTLGKSHWSWIFPAIIIVGALLSVRAQMKNQKSV